MNASERRLGELLTEAFRRHPASARRWTSRERGIRAAIQWRDARFDGA